MYPTFRSILLTVFVLLCGQWFNNALAQQCIPTITTPAASTLCMDDQVILVSSEASRYEWSTGATTRSITVDKPGTYWVKTTTADGCVGTSTAFKVPGKPDASIADPVYYFTSCSYSGSESSFTLTVQNTSTTKATNSSYTIDWGDGSTDTYGKSFDKARHTYNSAGSFNLVLTVTGEDGCTSTTTERVFIGSNPSLGLRNRGNSVDCAPATFTFDILGVENNSPYTQYKFWFDDGTDTLRFTQATLPASRIIEHTFDKSSSGKPGNAFTLNGTAITPCGFTPASVGGIKVSKGPSAGMSLSSTKACVGEVLRLTDTSEEGFNADTRPGVPANTYERRWTISPETGWEIMSGDFTSQNPSVKFTEAGAYTLTIYVTPPLGSSAKCQGDTAVKIINVLSPPKADFTVKQFPENGCTNNSVSITNKTIGEGLTFEWTVSPSTGWSYANGTNANSAEPEFNFRNAGNYKITLAASNECAPISTKDTTITVIGKPTATLPAAQVYCGPQTIAFSNSNQKHRPFFYPQLGTITGYIWTVNTLTDDGEYRFVNGNSNSRNPSIAFTKPGEYEVFVVAINQCGATSNIDKQKITIHPLPDLEVTAPRPAICVGENILLTASGADTYSWEPETGLSGTTGRQVIASPTETTTYTVTGINTTTGCTNTTTYTVVVNTPPTVRVSTSTSDICLGQGAATLSAAGASQYTWSPATGLNVTEGAEVIASPLVTTTYTVTGFDETTGCSNTASITVNVPPLPIVKAGKDITLCDEPVATQLQGSPAGGTWSGAHVTPEGAFTPAGKGRFTLTYTYTDAGGCTNSDQLTVTVSEILVANAGEDKEVCLNGGQLVLNGSPAGGTWGGSPHVSADGIFTPVNAGTFILTYTYYTGTCFTTDQLQVSVSSIPTAPVAAGAVACYNSSATLTASSSETGLNWYDAQGTLLQSGTSTGFTTPVLTSSADYFVEAVGSNGCNSPRTRVTVTVREQTPVPTVTSAAVCGPGMATLTAGGAATTFEWYDSATGGTLLYTGKTYTPAVSKNTTFYVQEVLAGCAGPRATAEVTVYPPLSDNVLRTVPVICNGQSPEALTGTAPTGGNGSYTYRWESSITSATTGFTTITGATTAHYQPGALTRPTWYRRIAVSAGCEQTSDAVKIDVAPVISQNTINGSQTLCAGQTPARLTGSLPAGGNGSYTYRWEVSTDGTNFSPVPNSNQTDLEPQALQQTTWYRRVAFSGPCAENISNVIIITVQPVIEDNTISTTDQPICAGETPAGFSGSKPTGGTGSYTYVWQSSTDGINFTPAAGQNNLQQYQPPRLHTTTYFRRTVNSGECTSISSIIKVTVTESIADNTISADQEVCAGSAPAQLLGSSPSGGDGTYEYLWEYSITGATTGFKAAPDNNTNPDYAPGVLNGTTWYRRRITSGTCSSYSAPVKITVNPRLANNNIMASQHIYAGTVPAILTGSIPTGGNNNYTYRWESSIDGVSFSTAGGADMSRDYAPGPLQQTTWFRRVASSGGCELISEAIEITVIPSINNNVVQASQTVCFGNAPATLIGTVPTGGEGSYIFRWESSTQGETGGYVTAQGKNNEQNYTPGPVNQHTWYRRVVTSGKYTHISEPIKVTVTQALGNNKISTSQIICFNTAPATLEGTMPTGGSGVYTYLWESSTDGPDKGFTTAAGVNNSIHYNPGILTQPTWFRRVVSSESCGSNVSDAITIGVIPKPKAPITAGATICAGSSATLSADGNGGRLEWYAEERGGLPLFTGTTYVTPSLDRTTIYYVQEVNLSCSSERQPVTATVTEPSANAGDDITTAKGRSIVLNGSGGVSYQWSPAAGLSNPNAANPTASPEKTTTYTLTVTTAAGCTFTDDVKVTVLEHVFVPNTFTPNRDGINDTWEIPNIHDYPGCRVQVFNQWGTMVFSSEGYGEPWDGRHNGKELPLATYYYIIHLDKNEKPLSGSVTIVK